MNYLCISIIFYIIEHEKCLEIDVCTEIYNNWNKNNFFNLGLLGDYIHSLMNI